MGTIEANDLGNIDEDTPVISVLDHLQPIFQKQITPSSPASRQLLTKNLYVLFLWANRSWGDKFWLVWNDSLQTSKIPHPRTAPM